MAGYESHDGKIAGNRQQVESYDKAHSKTSKHMGKSASMARGSRDGQQNEEGGKHDEIKSVIEEHGAAHSHMITAHRGGGHGMHGGGMSHHSETHHEDGHVHHADHESLEEAHEHGKAAMGADDAMTSGMPPIDESEAGSEAEGERGGGFMGSM